MLSIIYTKLGTIRFKLGETDAAKEVYLKSLEIAKYIATNTGARDAWRDVSINYDRLCDIYKTEGYLVLAKSYCIKSLDIRNNGLTLQYKNERKYFDSFFFEIINYWK